MSFLFNLNTKVHTETETKPVMNAINILKRDMVKVFGASDEKMCIRDRLHLFMKHQ